MKNKKTQRKGTYILLLLIGIVALGVGYASITNISLSILGTATANGSAIDSDFVVRFVKSADSSSENTDVATAAANPASYDVITGENVTASASITDDSTATFNVDGMVTGDEVTFTYYIANLSNGLSANVTPTITNEYGENFEVTVSPNVGSAFNLDEGEVQQVTVTVECVSQKLLDTTGSFTISFTSVATEN